MQQDKGEGLSACAAGVIVLSEDLHREAYNAAFKDFDVRCGGEPVVWSEKFYDMLSNTVGGGKPKMRWYFGAARSRSRLLPHHLHQHAGGPQVVSSCFDRSVERASLQCQNARWPASNRSSRFLCCRPTPVQGLAKCARGLHCRPRSVPARSCVLTYGMIRGVLTCVASSAGAELAC